MSVGELTTLAGYLVGGLVLWLEARRRGLATEGMRLVALAGIVGGVIGARLAEWALGAAHALWSHPGLFFDPRAGGKSLVGGLICGWLAVVWAKWKLGIHRSTGDVWALALPAGEAVGRLGCYFNGCCFGTLFGGPWAIFQHGAWRHPAQLYSAFGALFVFGVLFALRDKTKREGDLFRLYLILYGATRFGIEFFRERSFAWHNLSLVQLVCLEMAVGTLLLWWGKAQLQARRGESEQVPNATSSSAKTAA